MYLKRPGNLVYIIGFTGDDLGGSLAQRLHGQQGGRAPLVQLTSARRVFSAVHRANRKGLIQACHDLSEGGLAIAAAEMAIAGGHGLQIDLRDVPVTDPELAESTRLFAESPTRFLVEVTPADAPALETLLGRTPRARIGQVLDSPQFRVLAESGVAIDTHIDALRSRWQKPFAEATL
jgi:phosphoribosylformylglycinamidine synthase